MSKPVKADPGAPILITMGEPAGIGPEVAMAAYAALGGRVGAHPLKFAGDAAVFGRELTGQRYVECFAPANLL